MSDELRVTGEYIVELIGALPKDSQTLKLMAAFIVFLERLGEHLEQVQRETRELRDCIGKIGG